MLLLTSRYEGAPNVALEAQFSGLPVVATRVGGVEDIVVDGVRPDFFVNRVTYRDWRKPVWRS